jgi:hypothetical protein
MRTVVWKEERESQGSMETEHTVLPSVALWNMVFSKCKLFCYTSMQRAKLDSPINSSEKTVLSKSNTLHYSLNKYNCLTIIMVQIWEITNILKGTWFGGVTLMKQSHLAVKTTWQRALATVLQAEAKIKFGQPLKFWLCSPFLWMSECIEDTWGTTCEWRLIHLYFMNDPAVCGRVTNTMTNH